MSPTDKLLLKRWRTDRDADAFTEITGRYAAMVYATCRRILGNASEAEDAAQDCFLELARGNAKIRSSLGGWLHTVATHRSLDRIRSDKRRRLREQRFLDEPQAKASSEWDEVQRHVDEAITVLPEKLKAPLLMHFYEGRSYELVAESLGLTKSTAVYRVKRAVEHVRAALRRKGIVVPAAALTATLTATKAEAVPAGLSISLANLAVAGTGSLLPGAAALTLGGVVMLKKVLLGAAVLVLVILGFLLRSDKTTRPNHEQRNLASSPLRVPATDVPIPSSTPNASRGSSSAALSSSATVSGVLMNDRGRGLGGYGVALRVPNERNIHEGGFFDYRSLPATTCKPDGTFALEGVAAGEYAFEVGPVRGQYNDLLGAASPRISVRSGESLKDVRLVISLLSLGGTVVDQEGQPLEGVEIKAGFTRDVHFTAETKTGPDGTFRLVDVPKSVDEVNAQFGYPDYEAPSEFVPLSNGVEDNVVVMTRIESYVKPVNATVLDGETKIPIPSAEVNVGGDDWKPTYGRPVPLHLNWNTSRFGGLGTGFGARAEGYLPGNTRFNVEDVADNETVPVYLFRGGELEVSVELIPELLAAAIGNGWVEADKLKLYANTPHIQTSGYVPVDKFGKNRFILKAGPSQLVACMVNVHNLPLTPTGGEQSIYVRAEVSYTRNSDKPKAVISVGGTNSLTISLAGLKRAELKRRLSGERLNATPGSYTTVSEETYVSSVRNGKCSLAFLPAGVYEMTCTYVDAEGMEQNRVETVSIEGSNKKQLQLTLD